MTETLDLKRFGDWTGRGVLRMLAKGFGKKLREGNGVTIKRSLVIAVGLVASAGMAAAQNCTTQARMASDTQVSLVEQSLALANAVKANDSAKVQAATVPEYASNFGSTAAVIAGTSAKIVGDSVRVTQAYLLNANFRKAGDTSNAEFSCPLKDLTSEVDFSIPALPPGMYGFTTVEADGPRPWMLSFLLRQDGSAWKMAGFYSHARTAAGKDGLAYWVAARDAAKSSQPWLSWVLYGEADSLLRPVNFLTSTNLDKLYTEQHATLPPELSDGISQQTPLVIKAADGTEFRFVGLSAEGSDDGKKLNLMLHIGAEPIGDPVAAKARNLAAAKVMLAAHKELRKPFDGVWVFAESSGNAPFATEQQMSEIP